MPTPKRILIVISDFVGGGAERELSNFLARMPRDRFEPHLCLWRPVFDYPAPPGAPLHIVHKHHVWDAPKVIFRTARLIDELRPDLVFSHLPYVSLLTGLAVRKSRRQPRWIARLAGNPYWDFRPPLLMLARRVFPKANRVVGCSEGVARAAAKHLWTPLDRIDVLPNVVDVAAVRRLAGETPAVSRSQGVFTVVHAGRFQAQKNQDMLLRGFARLKGRSAELWMLGKGPLEKKIRSLATRLGIDSQIRWLGFQRNPYALFRSADCFALTSDHEGLPNVVIEALLCGAPTAATDCPFGPRELIHDGVDGRLIPVGDVEALANLLSDWLEQPSELEQMRGQGASRIATELDPEAVCRRYFSLFDRVLEN